MTPAEAAVDYAGRGWRVVPIMPASKRPSVSRWTDVATTDAEVLERWWGESYVGHGVGIVTGKESGLWVLDVDDTDALADLERRHRPLPDTLTSLTGSGGMHLVFAWPHDGREVRNDAGRRLGPGLDVRGEGGQIVAPPTLHPNGSPYTWDAGQPETPVDAPEWLLELVCAVEVPESGTEDRRTLARSDRPGDRWAAATSWGELLERDGWQLHHVDRDGECHWTRPGKELRDGTSATTGYKGSDALKVFTSSMRAAGLEQEETYTKLGYLAATRFDGDHAAAARFLAAQGWGEVEPAELEAWIDRTGSNEVAAKVADTIDALPDAATGDEGVDGGWEFVDLAPIVDGTHEPPTPTLLRRSDGVCLLYPGRVHSLAGEPGGGKTWIAMHVMAEVLTDGGTALLIDYEDSPLSAVHRLRLLGVADDAIRERLTYVRPTGPLLDRQGRIAARTLERLCAVAADVAVIDSVGESLATEGMKPNDDDAVANWFRLLPRRLARSGSAVLGVDHQAKDKEQRGLWAIGSQRKLAAIDGAAYVAQVKAAPTKERDGHLKIVCAKDRHGVHQQGHQVASVDILNAAGGVRVVVAAPESTFRPTVLMERISRHLEDVGAPMTQNAVEVGVKGKGDALRTALKVLHDEGYLDKQPGARGSFLWSSVRPFRAPDGLDSVMETPPRPTASPPRPGDAGRGQETTASTASPAYVVAGTLGDAVDPPGDEGRAMTASPSPEPSLPLDADPFA